MQTELTILTGHSRGMGRAMAFSLLAAGHRLLGISRGRLQGLGPSAGAPGELIEWQADLGHLIGLRDYRRIRIVSPETETR